MTNQGIQFLLSRIGRKSACTLRIAIGVKRYPCTVAPISGIVHDGLGIPLIALVKSDRTLSLRPEGASIAPVEQHQFHSGIRQQCLDSGGRDDSPPPAPTGQLNMLGCISKSVQLLCRAPTGWLPLRPIIWLSLHESRCHLALAGNETLCYAQVQHSQIPKWVVFYARWRLWLHYAASKPVDSLMR